jgi:hypothetical protein
MSAGGFKDLQKHFLYGLFGGVKRKPDTRYPLFLIGHIQSGCLETCKEISDGLLLALRGFELSVNLGGPVSLEAILRR